MSAILEQKCPCCGGAVEFNVGTQTLKCPYCDTIITKVFSDAKGHFRIKCQKCKAVTVLNIAYFRTMKGYGQYKSKYSSK